MRGSKAKKIRKFARLMQITNQKNQPVSPRLKCTYSPLKPSRVWSKLPVPGLAPRSALFLGQVKMDVRCVRAIYQNMKKRYRLANQFERRMP